MLSGALTVGPSDSSLEECGVASDFGVWGSVVTAEECPTDSGEDCENSAGGVPEGHSGDAGTSGTQAQSPLRRGRNHSPCLGLRKRERGAGTSISRQCRDEKPEVRDGLGKGPSKCGPLPKRIPDLPSWDDPSGGWNAAG